MRTRAVCAASSAWWWLPVIRNAACVSRPEADRANSTNSASPRAMPTLPASHDATGRAGPAERLSPRGINCSPGRPSFPLPIADRRGAEGRHHVDEGYRPLGPRPLGRSAMALLVAGLLHRLRDAGHRQTGPPTGRSCRTDRPTAASAPSPVPAGMARRVDAARIRARPDQLSGAPGATAGRWRPVSRRPRREPAGCCGTGSPSSATSGDCRWRSSRPRSARR